jgi:hypothetical protein
MSPSHSGVATVEMLETELLRGSTAGPAKH